MKNNYFHKRGLTFGFILIMEWFGLTLYGFPDPIKDMMRPDYKEPTVPPSFNEAVEKGLKTLKFCKYLLFLMRTVYLKKRINLLVT